MMNEVITLLLLNYVQLPTVRPYLLLSVSLFDNCESLFFEIEGSRSALYLDD